MTGTVPWMVETDQKNSMGANLTMIWKSMTVMAALMLSACSTTGAGAGKQASKILAEAAHPVTPPVRTTIVEAMGAGLIGTLSGVEIDPRDRRRALEAEYRALEYMQAGQVVRWGKAGSNRYGEVVPGSPYRVGSQDCRQYKHMVRIDDRSRIARGTACRNNDGSWTPLA